MLLKFKICELDTIKFFLSNYGIVNLNKGHFCIIPIIIQLPETLPYFKYNYDCYVFVVGFGVYGFVFITYYLMWLI